MADFINQMEPTYGEEEIKEVMGYLNSGGWIMEFKKTREFEQKICEYTGAKYCSVVSNGTISLFIALFALRVGPGDEVIVPNFTMVASPNAVKLCGATPVLVDIEKRNLCLDIKEVKKKITPKTKVIMHVSINGRAGGLDKLVEFCRERNIFLVEDAAQAFGSFYKGKHLGNYGVIGSFSFSSPKIITTGQGGALITNDENLYKKICKIKDFGRVSGGVDIHDEWGWNFKFTDLQAAFGVAQIRKMPERTKRKKEIYKLYKDLLSSVSDVRFIDTDLNEVAPWFIDILVDEPVKLRDFLKEKGVGSRVFYPPVSDQVIYETKEKYPNTEDIAYHGLWLPSSVKLTDDQVGTVCREIEAFCHVSKNN